MKKFVPMKKFPPKVEPAGKVDWPLVAKLEEEVSAIEAHTPALKNALAEQTDREYVKEVSPKPLALDVSALHMVEYKYPIWLTIGEVAKHIKMPLTKFGKLRHTGGPKFYELPEGLILYNVHDVDEWVMSHLPLAIKVKTEETNK